MSGLNLSRQHDIFRTEQALSRVTVIGAGGIGSVTVLALAKMGVPHIKVLDFDVVEEHNAPSQLYRLGDIGKSKVAALAEAVRDYTGCQIEAVAERYADQALDGVVISAVDSIQSRQAIWNAVKWNPDAELLIDPRMGGQVAIIHMVRPCDPDDIKRYEQHLFPPEKAAADPCTARAIVYNTFGIAAQVCAMLRRWWVVGEIIPCFRGDFETLTFLK